MAVAVNVSQVLPLRLLLSSTCCCLILTCIVIHIPAGQLFARVDAVLRSQRLRFQELFSAYDGDGSGALEVAELARLVNGLMAPEGVNASDMGYLQVSGGD